MKFVYVSVFLAVSTLFIMPLSVPIFNHLVVVMRPDPSVNRAADAIKQEIPDAIVVEYGSLEYSLVAYRAYGGVTWISHGSEANVELGTEEKNWREMVPLIRMTPSNDIVLACHSDALHEYLDSNEVYTFPGPVDSVLGALFVASLITRSPSTIHRFVDYGVALLEGKQSIDTLYLVGYLSNEEAIYWLAISMMTFGAILFNYYTDFGFWQTAAYILVSAGQTEILITLIWLYYGWITPLTAAARIVGFILGTMIGTMYGVLTGNIFALLIFIACVVATVAMWGASAGTIAAAQIVLAIAAGLAFLVGLVLDYCDTNTIVG